MSSVLNVILAVASAPPSIRVSIVRPHLGSGCLSPSGNNSVRTDYHKGLFINDVIKMGGGLPPKGDKR